MQSNGGSITIAEARKSGVRCILSGPAGGVVGCQYIGELAQESLHPASLKLLTFDMGGTSTDVSMIDGQAQVTSEAEVGGLPIRIPILDIHTIGAGGGSIARIDAGGALRVGPESAGADPGPACYGKSLSRKMKKYNALYATVTDANLLLGRIPVLGMLFRSSSFKREESELLVIVTARLARPVAPHEVPPLPTAYEHNDVGDIEFFLMGWDSDTPPSERGYGESASSYTGRGPSGAVGFVR